MRHRHRASLSSLQPRALLLSLLVCFLAAVMAQPTIPLLLRVAMAAEPAAGTASGSLTVDGKKTTLSHAYAMAQPNTFEKTKTDIAVLLTEKPLQEGVLKDVEDLLDAAPKDAPWAFFRLDEEKKVDYEVISHPALEKTRLMMSSIATKARFTPKVFAKDRVEGSFETSKEETIFDHTYAIKASFSAPLLQAKVPEPLPNAKTGTPLPAGGGEPGKAYLAFVAALHKKDLAAVRKMAPQDQADMSEEELKEALEFFVMMTPKDIKITKGYVKGDRAALYVSGTLDNEKQYGTIEMTKLRGEWRPLKSSWSNTPPQE